MGNSMNLVIIHIVAVFYPKNGKRIYTVSKLASNILTVACFPNNIGGLVHVRDIPFKLGPTIIDGLERIGDKRLGCKVGSIKQTVE